MNVLGYLPRLLTRIPPLPPQENACRKPRSASLGSGLTAHYTCSLRESQPEVRDLPVVPVQAEGADCGGEDARSKGRA
jgi:hypothetical protein